MYCKRSLATSPLVFASTAPPLRATARIPPRAMSLASRTAHATPRARIVRARVENRRARVAASATTARGNADVSDDEMKRVRRREALATALALGMISRADDARAIGFKKELKKRGPLSEDAYAETAAFDAARAETALGDALTTMRASALDGSNAQQVMTWIRGVYGV